MRRGLDTLAAFLDVLSEAADLDRLVAAAMSAWDHSAGLPKHGDASTYRAAFEVTVRARLAATLAGEQNDINGVHRGN